MLEALMQRRHHIVYRADKSGTGDGLQTISPRGVKKWLTATTYFMGSMAKAGFEKQHPFEVFAKELHELAKQIDAKPESDGDEG